MRIAPLLLALVLGGSPIAFDVCQLVCAATVASEHAMPAGHPCHRARSASSGALPASIEPLDACEHGSGLAIAPGVTPIRRSVLVLAATVPPPIVVARSAPARGLAGGASPPTNRSHPHHSIPLRI